jgi:hypothetical protein
MQDHGSGLPRLHGELRIARLDARDQLRLEHAFAQLQGPLFGVRRLFNARRLWRRRDPFQLGDSDPTRDAISERVRTGNFARFLVVKSMNGDAGDRRLLKRI